MKHAGRIHLVPVLVILATLAAHWTGLTTQNAKAKAPAVSARTTPSYRMSLAVQTAEQKGTALITVYGDISEYRFDIEGTPVYLAVRGQRRALYGAGAGKEMGHALGLNLPDLRPHMERNYRVRREGIEYLGRPAWQETADPRHPGNPSRVTFYDRSTGAVLKQEDRDRDGRLMVRREATRFEEVPFSEKEYKRLAETLRTKGHDVPHFTSPAQARRALGFSPAVPSYLPEGYVSLGVRVSRRRARTAHAMFSDGIGIISLYAQEVPWWARRNSAPKAGAVIEWEHAGIHYVLVGDVPPAELGRVAQSMPQ